MKYEAIALTAKPPVTLSNIRTVSSTSVREQVHYSANPGWITWQASNIPFPILLKFCHASILYVMGYLATFTLRDGNRAQARFIWTCSIGSLSFVLFWFSASPPPTVIMALCRASASRVIPLEDIGQEITSVICEPRAVFPSEFSQREQFLLLESNNGERLFSRSSL